MKKQRKPRSKPQKQKARSAPLPLDTSRRHPTAPKSASSPTRNAASRRHSTANRQHGLRTVVGMIWSRLAATSRSDRADAAMLALPVLLIGLTIGVARWTNADLATREFATITPGAKHALNGLPPVATPVSPLLPAPAAATVPRQTSMPVLAAPIAEATPANSTPVSVPSAELETQFQLPLGSPPEAVAVAVDRTTPTPLNLGPFPKAALTSRPDETVGAVAADPDQHAAVAPSIATAVLSPDRSVTAQDLAGGVDALAAGPTQCRIETEPPLSITWTPGNQESFGLALAAAARRSSRILSFIMTATRASNIRWVIFIRCTAFVPT